MVAGLSSEHIEGLEQFPDAVERKETGIHGDDRLGAGLEGVERQQTDVRRAINDEVIVVAGDTADGVGQDVLPADESRESFGERTQQNIGGSHIEVFANAVDDVSKHGAVSA